ncbi:MAG: VanZ family protein [Gammaproteobacteria bacterium]|nr:MAG: VanZ family protein [Gammaproteobacteria bacterium]RKZ74034.1 MAG: VanZ family protein [Gammaproteobacteria bacterium]
MKIDFSSRLGLKKLWVGIGWLLVIAVIVLSLIPSPPLMMQTIDYGDKIGHLIAYFVLMGWFALVYHMPRQRFWYMIGFLLLGGVLEILQGLSGIRHADWMDIVANSIGVLLAWQLTKYNGLWK